MNEVPVSEDTELSALSADSCDRENYPSSEEAATEVQTSSAN